MEVLQYNTSKVYFSYSLLLYYIVLLLNGTNLAFISLLCEL